LGKQGEKVSVKRQFGYNNLLLPKLAVYATPENEKLYATDGSVKSIFSSKEAPRVKVLDFCSLQLFAYCSLIFPVNSKHLIIHAGYKR
jgi:Ribosomal protein L9, N-terminal domain